MNIVSILGNTNSGCGAIYEYLIGRPDTKDPFEKAEFRILSDPGGINDLNSCYENYSLQNFNEKINKLITLERKYRPKRTWFKDGLNLVSVIGYKEAWNEYLTKIKGKEFTHRYIFNDIKKHTTNKILKKIITRLGYRDILFRKYWTGVTKREFRNATYQFLNKIIDNSSHKENIKVLNQAGTYWSPLTSTELIGEPKIITVSRNPLDQYAELKLHKGMKNAEEYLNWYLHLKKMEAREQFLDERVLEIKFEDFIMNHKHSKEVVCNHLGLDPDVNSNYKVDDSKKNIGKYIKILSTEEIEIIKDSFQKNGINYSL